MNTERSLAAAVVLALTVAACGGGAGDGAAGGTAETEDARSARSSLPVQQPTGPVDEELAERGEELFQTRGCVACHTVGQGKRVGPDLRGVTERRDFEWMYHMVTNPDSMLRSDSTARSLLGEYFTPMADQNVQPEQFRALYEYLRSEAEE